ncbi:MAG TPA: class I SAM-dependent RNA methyltransferase [Actinocrinis sp.]|nr:class I SAM-dependent RNA methyltransferase [Actinocrinis sp.]
MPGKPSVRPSRPAPEPEHRPSSAGERFTVTVGPVANGGFCVARHEGRAVFVRHALPGERVVVEVTQGGPQDRFLRADAVEVLEASADRVQAPCEYAGPGRCGGCDWQHASLDAQRRLKGEVVAEQLRHLAKIDVDVVVESAPAGPGDPWADGLGWRSRVQFAVDPKGRLGLRRSRSHEVEPVDHCLIASAGVEEVGAEKRRWPQMASVEVIAPAGSSDRAVVVTPEAGTRVPLVEGDVPVSVLRGDGKGGIQRIHGRAHVREVAADRTWRVSGSGFWQVHPAAAGVLSELVLAWLDPQAGETALDLYCGVGLFAAGLAEAVGAEGEVVAVESDGGAVVDATANLAGFEQVELVEGRVDKVLAEAPDGFLADVAVLDPPRSGAGRTVVGQLAALRPRAIVYVACDPASLGRDLAYFAEAGYRLDRLRAFDFFPMTQHVECVALLSPDS